MTEDVEWSDIEQAAKRVFRAWGDSSCELNWAHHAWSHLQRAGLTSYEEDEEVDRYRVAARFISLCNLYYDFIHLAWQEEGHSLFYRELADILGCEASGVVALARSHREWEDDPDGNADDLLEDALKFLSDAERDAVVKALVDGFGGEDQFFCDLWRSRPEYHYQAFGEAMNEPTTHKMVAYEWITGRGCENLRNVRDGFC